MSSQFFAVFACLALLAAPAVAQEQIINNEGSRHLTQAKAATVPSCLWAAEGNVCIPNMQNMLAVPTTVAPTNVFRRAYMMALDRSDVCTKYATEAACNADTANRCFWKTADKAKVCLGADFAEVGAFERSGYVPDLATIPSSMTCPGSRAADFFNCYAHPAPEMCSKMPGCAPAPAGTAPRPVCLSKYAAGLDKKAADVFAAQIRALDPAVFGTCEAACWLKQAKACSSSAQAACEKNAQCVWNPIAKACAKQTVAKTGKDVFDDSVGTLMTACSALKSQATCQAKTVTLQQAGMWKSWKQSAAPATC